MRIASVVAAVVLLTLGAASVLAQTLPESGQAPAATSPPPSPVDTWLDRSHKAVQVVAIIVAGIWTYYLFFRGRTFRPRLEPALETSVIPVGTARHLKIKAKLKNVGLSQVPIDRENSALRVFAYRPDDVQAAKAQPVAWQREYTEDVFKDHAWVEPGETIEDNWLFALPDTGQDAAYRVELKLAGPADWYANALVEVPTKAAPTLMTSLRALVLQTLNERSRGERP